MWCSAGMLWRVLSRPEHIWHIQLLAEDANWASLSSWRSDVLRRQRVLIPQPFLRIIAVFQTAGPLLSALNPWDLNVGEMGVGVTLSKELLLLPDNPTHAHAHTCRRHIEHSGVQHSQSKPPHTTSGKLDQTANCSYFCNSTHPR